ncbi:hypothetical protein [Nonomuraea sp. NPDC049709]|uniref:hypothetical protein n=1 Tax=Nonomuraea sp. NPDC049709 TaxID=3154736 RepID=UPI003417BF41
MQNPTSDSPPPAPLLRYETWTDTDGFHARYTNPLSSGALHYGCRQTITAATELELRQEAVRNRILISVWDTHQRFLAAEQLSNLEDRTEPPAE